MVAACTNCGHTDYETRRAGPASASVPRRCPVCGHRLAWVPFVTALELERQQAEQATNGAPPEAPQSARWFVRAARRVARR